MSEIEAKQSDRYKRLGVFRLFSFVRYLFDEKEEMRLKITELEEKLDKSKDDLIFEMKKSNNVSPVDISNTNNHYERQRDETIEQWIQRTDELSAKDIKKMSENKIVVESASSILEREQKNEAVRYVRSQNESGIKVSDSAVLKIANMLPKG